MDYSALVEIYDKIDATTKRLEIAEHLSNFLKTVPPDIIDRVMYLMQGRLYPDFAGIEVGLAEKLVIASLAFATGLPEKELTNEFIEKGDMGEVAENAVAHKKQRNLFFEPLSIERVYSNLDQISRSSGPGSQDLKIKLLAELLHDSKPTEAKYLVRTVLAKLRLGVADMTLIDALAKAFATKEDKNRIERAYNLCSDIGLVAKKLVSSGISSMDSIHITVGIPVHAMLAERLSSIDEIIDKMGGECAFEHKYDGLRIQAHIDRGGGVFRLFSRRLEEVTGQFPDVIEALRIGFKGNSAILDGEAVPIDINTGDFLPFQEVSRRRGRKYDVGKTAEEIPVHLFLFDCLFLDGRDCTELTYPDRRKILESIVFPEGSVKCSERLVTGNAADASRFFDSAIENGLEGIVAKSLGPDSAYKAGARGWQWIKYKKDYKSEMYDTVDLVVVGAFAGHGRRAGGYGALLMAAYNGEENTFETVCKLGSGFDDKIVAALPEMLKKHKIGNIDKRVRSGIKADFWFEPSLVAEVIGAEITISPIHKCGFGKLRDGAGLAIRFPRFTGNWREDKSPQDATSSEDIEQMYKRQLKKLG